MNNIIKLPTTAATTTTPTYVHYSRDEAPKRVYALYDILHHLGLGNNLSQTATYLHDRFKRSWKPNRSRNRNHICWLTICDKLHADGWLLKDGRSFSISERLRLAVDVKLNGTRLKLV